MSQSPRESGGYPQVIATLAAIRRVTSGIS
jgi:hypothetical protein